MTFGTILLILLVILVAWFLWHRLTMTGSNAISGSSLVMTNGASVNTPVGCGACSGAATDQVAMENIRYQTQGLNWQVRYPFDRTWLRPYYFRWGHSPYYPSRDVLVDKTVV